MNPLQARQLVIDIPGRGDGEALNFAVNPGRSGAFWGQMVPARRRSCTHWRGCEHHVTDRFAWESILWQT